jgi:hypothetical protein
MSATDESYNFNQNPDKEKLRLLENAVTYLERDFLIRKASQKDNNDNLSGYMAAISTLRFKKEEILKMED